MTNNLAPDLIDRTLAAFGRALGAFTGEQVWLVLLAALPVAVWLYIFFRRQKENKALTCLTFLGGMLAVVPIFVLQYEINRIDNWITSLGFSTLVTVFLTSLWVGMYEETAKMWVVKKADRKFFRNIDDAIEFSIFAALGFAFLENILYFYNIWNNPAINNFWFYYVFRSLGSMFLHVFASGIFGYYYGLAHFAQPVLQEELARGKKLFFTKWLHRILHLKSETLFHEEKIMEGLLIAAGIHGAFDLMMGLSQHYSDLGSLFWSKLWLTAAIPFLASGYFLLTYLLDKKENHKVLGNLTEERTSPSSDNFIGVQEKSTSKIKPELSDDYEPYTYLDKKFFSQDHLSRLFFSCRGRINRSRYFESIFLVDCVFAIIISVVFISNPDSNPYFIGNIFTTLSSLLFLAPLVKRCHDKNWSGWTAILSFVPIASVFFNLILLFGRGTPGKNQYGPDSLLTN